MGAGAEVGTCIQLLASPSNEPVSTAAIAAAWRPGTAVKTAAGIQPRRLRWLVPCTMRAELIGHFEPCMTEIYLRIDARMADYVHTHP